MFCGSVSGRSLVWTCVPCKHTARKFGHWSPKTVLCKDLKLMNFPFKSANTNLWCVWCVKKSEFSEGFVWRCVRAVWDRRAGSFPVVLDVGPLRWPSVQPRGFPRWRWTVGKDNTARWPQVRRGPKTIFAPQFHVVVPSGLVQGAAAPFQQFADGVPSHRHRGINLRKARLSSGAVVNVLNGVVLPVAGCKL